MLWIPQKCKAFIDDFIQLQEQGHRMVRKKKTVRPRYYNQWTAHRNDHRIWAEPNWWRMPNHERSSFPNGRQTPTIASYELAEKIMFVNVDDHWGIRGRNMRRYLVNYCHHYGIPCACVSYGALGMAELSTDAIVPLVIEKDPYWGQTPECIFKTKRGQRYRRYIGGWDHNDRIPRYFMAELPKGAKANTLKAARRSLAPPIVQEAWDTGIPVVRQGDVFAIKTELREKDLKRELKYRAAIRHWWPISQNWGIRQPFRDRRPWGETPEGYRERRRRHDEATRVWLAKRENWRDMASRLSIYGTAHTATEVIRLNDGRIFGKGMLRHDPNIIAERRMRDHQNVRLDDGRDGWWLFARNTVPPAT